MTDIKGLNRILHAIRNRTAWTLDDADLAVIEGEEWPVPDPNYGEPWLQKYVVRVGTEPGVRWSQVADAIRARRPKPVAAPAIAAAQPVKSTVASLTPVTPDPVANDPEIARRDADIARLQKEAAEADERVRALEAAQAKPSPTSASKQASSPAGGDHPKVFATQTKKVLLGSPRKIWNEQVTLLKGYHAEPGGGVIKEGEFAQAMLPTPKTFRRWLKLTGLDVLLEQAK